MAIITEIRAAIADQLEDAFTGADWDIQVGAKMIGNPTPPTVDVYPGDPTRDDTTLAGGFAGTDADAGDAIWINVRARVSMADTDAGQDILDEFGSPDSDLSIVQALYDDPTLGGIAADVDFVAMGGYELVPRIDGSGPDLGVVWRFAVIPARS